MKSDAVASSRSGYDSHVFLEHQRLDPSDGGGASFDLMFDVLLYTANFSGCGFSQHRFEIINGSLLGTLEKPNTNIDWAS